MTILDVQQQIMAPSLFLVSLILGYLKLCEFSKIEVNRLYLSLQYLIYWIDTSNSRVPIVFMSARVCCCLFVNFM